MTPYGYPAFGYHCLLDEQPYYLVPPRRYGYDVTGPLIVNPLCWFSWHGPLPADMASRAVSVQTFVPSECILWVDDAATRSLWPYWVGQEYIEYLGYLVPGQPLDIELPAHALWVLTRAHILVSPEHDQARRRAWLDTVLASAASFQRGYTTVTDLIPPFHLGALRRYYRARVRMGAFQLGDNQVERRYAAHNEPVAGYVQVQLRQAVSDIVGVRVKPSYNYLAAYQSGSVLDRHVDREQCEYSITMCIDASPEPEVQAPWPINLDTADGSLRMWQYLGDSLLYRGRWLPHYREPLPEGCSSTSMLLHYVDQDYGGSLS